MMLTSRVRDDATRKMAETFRSHVNKIGICRTEKESEDIFNKIFPVLEPLHKRIGEILRKLDDDEDVQSMFASGEQPKLQSSRPR
jgi:CHASE2 domain-containing sensor protein